MAAHDPLRAASIDRHRRCAHRHLGLALRAVARRVLPAAVWCSATSSRIRLAPALDDRDQRLVLFAAGAVELGPLVRRDAGRLRLQRQGPALHHPHEAAARDRCADGELLRVGRAAARPQARPGAVAVPAELRVRSERPSSRSSRRCRSTPTRRCARRAARSPRRRPHLARDRCGAAASAMPSRCGIRASSIPTSSRCCASTALRSSSPTRAGSGPRRTTSRADFVYVRLHGSQTLYQSAYTDAELDRWAARIAAWRTGGQVADARLISSRRTAAPPSGAMSSATSTTPTSCRRRSMRSG